MLWQARHGATQRVLHVLPAPPPRQRPPNPAGVACDRPLRAQTSRARVLLPGSRGRRPARSSPRCSLTGHGFSRWTSAGSPRHRGLIVWRRRIPTYVLRHQRSRRWWKARRSARVFRAGLCSRESLSGSIVNQRRSLHSGRPAPIYAGGDRALNCTSAAAPEGELPGFTGAIGSFDLGRPEAGGQNVARGW